MWEVSIWILHIDVLTYVCEVAVKKSDAPHRGVYPPFTFAERYGNERNLNFNNVALLERLRSHRLKAIFIL